MDRHLADALDAHLTTEPEIDEATEDAVLDAIDTLERHGITTGEQFEDLLRGSTIAETTNETEGA